MHPSPLLSTALRITRTTTGHTPKSQFLNHKEFIRYSPRAPLAEIMTEPLQGLLGTLNPSPATMLPRIH